jgi:tryptophan 2,3-dioxygenase
MRLAALSIGVLLSAGTLSADDRSISFDKTLDFSKLKTFAVHEPRPSLKPELDAALRAAHVSDIARRALRAKGLTETSDYPDVVVECRVTEGTLVIDLTTGPPAKLVWHGVYRRSNHRVAKLAEKLPGEAKELLSSYPPKKK